MEVNLGLFVLIKLGLKLISHKILQCLLKTKETTIIETTHGKVKGVKRKSVYGKSYYAFEGIPFAQPPLGALRFRAPQPADPWDGVRDCTKPGNKPMQKHIVLKIVEGSEDCLYLNIYAKTLQTDNPIPVLVWIYGGGFQIGEASRDLYSPDYFMDKDVVLIEVSYRLGALGFLTMSDPNVKMPGNAGLKDQLLALQWIKNNCAAFNGDSKNITIFGESAGGASTHYMMITDKAKGLFHKGILMSGSALCPWADTPQYNWAYRLAKSIGYKGENNDKHIADFLSNINAKEIVKADNCLLTLEEKLDRVLFSFGPVVEPYITDDCIIPDSPRELMKTAWGNEIPLLIGGTSFEGLYVYAYTLKNRFLLDDLKDCERVVPLDLNLPLDSTERKRLGLLLKTTHFGNTQNCREQLLLYLDLISYKYFWHGIHRTALSRLTYATRPTYLYRFDFDSADFNQFRVLSCGKEVRGTSHADDLSYLFYTIASWRLPSDSPEYRTIQRMIDIVTTFAATSDPNCDSIKQVTWHPLEKTALGEPLKCMNISNDVEFIDLPETNKLKVWDSLYSREQLY